MSVAVSVRPREGSVHSGDAVEHWRVDATTLLCVVDGLGHGEAAARAARAAVDYVAAHLGEPLTEVFAGCDRAIAETRGVAMSLARVDSGAGTLEHAAVGNTRAMLLAGPERRMFVSTPGIVGGSFQRILVESTPVSPGERLFLYTDGLPAIIDTRELHRRLRGDAIGELAEALVHTLGARSDDSAVLIYEHGADGPPGDAGWEGER